MHKTLGMLIGIVVGYVIWFFWLGIDFSKVFSADWIALPVLPRFFHFPLVFELGAIMDMILMYIVQAVQTIGDVSSTAVDHLIGRQVTRSLVVLSRDGYMRCFRSVI